MAWFCATYGGLAVACALAPPNGEPDHFGLFNAGVLMFATVCTAGFLGAAWRVGRVAWEAGQGASPQDRFFARAGSTLYAVAAFSTAWVAWPALVLPPCV